MKTRLFIFLKSYFGFSNRESRGFVLLIPAMIILYAIPKIYETFLQKNNEEKYKAYILMVDSLMVLDNRNLIETKGFNSLEIHKDTIKKQITYQKPKTPSLSKIPFDEADSIVLQVVPGIGQTMAGRIVKFRESLGGLHHKDQILEVYGMNPEVAERIFEHFEFRPGISKKLPINEAELKTLASHPYINYGTAKVIIAYRNQHGKFNNAEDLLKIKILNQEWVDRLKPYLEF